MVKEENSPPYIPERVAQAYRELRKLDRKHELLKYITKVGPHGTFIWSTKKERLNGAEYPRWKLFYQKFSGNGVSLEEISEETRWQIPELLKTYEKELRKTISILENQ